MSMTSADLHHRFRAVWRKETTLHLLRGACHVAAWGVVLLFVTLGLDWWLDLPSYVRIGALAGVLGVLVGLACRRGIRHVRRYDPLRTALRLGAEHPPMDSLLVAYVELHEDRPPRGISAPLIAAARGEAVRRAGPLPFEDGVRLSSLRRIAAVSVVALLALLGFGVARWPVLGVFVRRMVAPFADVGYPTRTTIEGFSGDLVVKRFDPVEVYARVGGELPENGRLYVRMKGLGWERIDLSRTGKGTFRHLIGPVRSDFEYYFRLGDAKSRRASVAVAYPPRIVRSRIDLEYPRYTRLGPQQAETFNLKLPEGTKIGWHLQLDRPVEAVEVATEDRGARQMELAEGATVARLALPAAASTSYRFRFRWRLRDRRYVHEGARHFIRVIPDQPPAVDLLFPAEDEKATLRKTLAISFVGRDDYGLSRAWIVYSLNDASERKHPLALLGGDRSAMREASWTPTDTLPDLKVGDMVTYAIEVSDDCSGPQGPQLGRSRSRRVQFVSQTDYLAYVQELYRKYLGQVRPLYLRERDSVRRVGALVRSRPEQGRGTAAQRPGGEGNRSPMESTRPSRQSKGTPR